MHNLLNIKYFFLINLLSTTTVCSENISVCSEGYVILCIEMKKISSHLTPKCQIKQHESSDTSTDIRFYHTLHTLYFPKNLSSAL